MRNDTKLDILWDDVQELKASGGGGGGSELPDVTSADNGKILGVVNGAWNKMDAPSGAIDYSTTEQLTGQKWTDGRNIYQVTKSITIDADNDEISLTTENPDLIINTFGYVRNPTAGVNRNVPYYNNADYYLSFYYAESDKILHVVNKGRSQYSDLAVTIQYVKPTATETKATKKKTTKNKED